MIRLSVAIITYNEARNIGRCLDSVQAVADEIVVVDSFSTDDTEAICKEREVVFIKHAFEGHIEQKNYAMSRTSFDYVLSLDADEALDTELIASILKVKRNWPSDGYKMNRLTNYCGKWIRHCGWYPDIKLRLVDKRKGKWVGLNPHDRYELESDSKTTHLSGHILHYSFYHIAEHVAQVNRFTDIMAKAKMAHGKKAPLWKILLSPIHKFIKSYFFQLGILDGYYGFVVCAISAQATFLRYAKLRELYAQSTT